ncbi:pyridoxamine 5'-phosphate oxidase family protein [Mucilaginibacter psychrotolerans]|uniref:Pyridoxamine 5'-phosphate oxidase family protein n=1 Tax=Mucilaginibacter psychrotolerans TaxID=1524096 RepID=A0A4Y8S8F8_9SPHI|nr:pyridoxamine 5'-phosphate oxidase family protein [Mucilaginibacter psychrotolerans]TFF35363.1 pyridoxamine 5'-phosphate oxidase family protein [Mucilaginibacter psychrotolerans]
MNFAKFAFTDGIKALQEQNGSRQSYARMEALTDTDGLTESEIEFIESRNSFYMASIGENGYPYIQHRGGPVGFIKVINAGTIGLVDYRGNKQFISLGNLLVHQQVALFLMDYPHRTRLKIYADARIVDMKDDPALFNLLDPADYKHTPERMFLFDVKAFDWNCPQHITPRYTEEEIKRAFAPQNDYVLKLEYELENLKKQLADKKS